MGSGNLFWSSISLLCGTACPNSASRSLLRLFFPKKVLPSGDRSRPAKGAPTLPFPPHCQACNVLFRSHGASVEIDIDGTFQHLLTLPFCWAARPPGPPPNLSWPSVSPLSRGYP